MIRRNRLHTFSLVAAVLIGAALAAPHAGAAYSQVTQILGGTSTNPIIDTTSAGVVTVGGTNATGFAVSLANTTGNSIALTNNALLTGVGINYTHTTSVLADGGSLARLSSTAVDTGGATHGTLLDLVSSAAPAATLMELTDTALTTGRGVFATHTTGVMTTGSLMRLTNTTVDTGTGQGTLLDLNSTGCVACVVAMLNAPALTSGTALKIIGTAPATMTSAGSFLKVSDGTTDVLRVGQNGVLISAQTTVPTVASTGDGATGGCASCTDTRGVATDTTAANTNAIVITFNTTRTPVACTVSPGNAATAVDLKAAGGGILTYGAGTLSISAPSGNWAANAKSINYICFY